MKRYLLICLTFLLLVMIPLVTNAASYVGNKSSYKFHFQGCQWERKMSYQNKVYFNSRSEAINVGYIPCKVCKP